MTRAELEAALAWADWLARSKDPGPALAMAKVIDRLKEQYARVAGNPRGDITGGGEMSGTNPGAWPDDWHGDVDDGKRKAFAELDKTIPLYTAAEMKAARLETVERCIRLADDVAFVDSVLESIVDKMKKLKEEIENEG